MQIFVNSLGRTVVLDVESSSLIENVKYQLEEREGIPCSEQRLISCGKQINEGTLEENNIKNNSTVHLLLRLSGGSSEKPWDLYYWPGLPGRGEFVRVVLEDAGVPYRDMPRVPTDQGGGVPGMMALMSEQSTDFPVFAPPFIRKDDILLSQTANICLYLAKLYDLAPTDELGIAQANQLGMTIMDFVAEAHDTHHPISNALYYEDQKDQAKKKAENFRNARIPKFFFFFERALKLNNGKALYGNQITYVDLMLFHLLCGLEYAFPKAYARHIAKAPLLAELKKKVAERPKLAAYLKSERRLPFNEKGIFRKYPELDD